MSDGGVPIVVCVSPDVAVREHVLRRLDGVGPVVSCADLAELRAMLFAEPTAGQPVESTPARPGESTPAQPHESNPARPVDGQPVEPVGAEQPVSFGDLLVDPGGHLVTWRGRPLALTRTERELLARLASPPVSLWSYERLFASVWGGAYLGDTAILHSAMKRLRHKLRVLSGGPRVQTVRGVGYRLVTAPDDPPG
ncbi:winged helix-turn-helix domain-containing protein [Micromonospora sp. WMMA1363]|uniref:winged helix-turn-helix domain-containing protein n=1 Tax=Micromonospora sp. WMMA1363 TaxID=3053985 RepID=UPI00259D1A24|nr:winged helix-turn-helix domain-containing protein [Micromonospora sp. WMMA1363]MDM4721013.1 winged helix-turn-helix domain-containing protein [Micromonospora sp. WMMA1363]